MDGLRGVSAQWEMMRLEDSKALVIYTLVCGRSYMTTANAPLEILELVDLICGLFVRMNPAITGLVKNDRKAYDEQRRLTLSTL